MPSSRRSRTDVFHELRKHASVGEGDQAGRASKKMPPWFADPAHGKFANDRSLSAADINTLVSWVDGGAKAGNPKDAPKPIAFTEGWVIGQPDKVFEIPTRVRAFRPPARSIIST